MSTLLETANRNAIKIFLVAASLVVIVFIIAVSLKPENKMEDIQPSQSPQVQVRLPQPNSPQITQEQIKLKIPEPTSAEYSKKIKALLRAKLKSIDAHLEIQGSTKWLFITIDYSEWRSMEIANQKEMVNVLLRDMKKSYSDDYSYLQVSVGVDEKQPLAEGKWSPLGNPEIELIGE